MPTTHAFKTLVHSHHQDAYINLTTTTITTLTSRSQTISSPIWQDTSRETIHVELGAHYAL